MTKFASTNQQTFAAQSRPAAGTPLQQSECLALKRMADCLYDMASKGSLPFQPGEAAQDVLQHFTNLSTHEVPPLMHINGLTFKRHPEL